MLLTNKLSQMWFGENIILLLALVISQDSSRVARLEFDQECSELLSMFLGQFPTGLQSEILRRG